MIGGLNPHFLATRAPIPHQGTTDIDLLFALGFDNIADSSDFSWVDTALAAGGFTSINGWRWNALRGNAQVRLEFLCDIWDHIGDTVPLPGSRSAVASKIAGPAAALHAPVERQLVVSARVRADTPEPPETVSLRFASLGGYLLAKAAAAQSRMLAKDKYDLMYVILYNEGGPREAARAVARQLVATMDSSDPVEIRRVVNRYLDPEGSWSGVFAETMIGTGDSATEDQLRVDAAEGARSFLDELESA
ncbi:hypothetical protein ACFC14_02690 [Microbacterium sp. NPDC055988]|uniref:hypothetical protein n=1 Tax=Microbacterium sp. NPDC055988 TaxID=3345671 RepID=UPI0035E18797